MKHDCAIRVSNRGVIMYSTYDDETMLIDGIPKEKFYGNFRMVDIRFHNRNYENFKIKPVPISELEYRLRTLPTALVAIEVGKKYTMIVDSTGRVYGVNDKTDETNFGSYYINSPMSGLYYSCGIAKTRVLQVQSQVSHEIVYYDMKANKLFVRNGFVDLDFCSPEELDFKSNIPIVLYKAIVHNNDEYIISTKTHYIILDKDMKVSDKIERRF